MHRMFGDRYTLRKGLLFLIVWCLFSYAVSEISETWYEYKERTAKERKNRAKSSKKVDQSSAEEVHSRRKRAIGFPTGSTFTITPVLCIPVVNLGDLSGFLDIELPFTIRLPNATQITYAGRYNDDRIGIYTVVIDALNRFGFNGKSCLLRAICEIAETPLKHDGLMGEIINIVLGISPDSSDPSMRDYVEAEHNGRAYGDCVSLYPDCPISIFKLVEG